jgi:hypothetical protein
MRAMQSSVAGQVFANFAAPQHHSSIRAGALAPRKHRDGYMLNDNQKGLLIYLAERAHELATLARAAEAPEAAAMIAEAEELMAIRSSIISRGAQFELPLEVQEAA